MDKASLCIMTFNIRYDNDWDKEHSWESRKERVVEKIKTIMPHSLGIQEGLIHQVKYLASKLQHYDYAGIAREDGHEKGEFAAIFYDTKKLKLLETDTFWLSETPEQIGSLGWDADCTRICTWAKFQVINSNNVFYHFNTHFDHAGSVAQKESAKLIIKIIKEIAGRFPTVLSGDLNVTPDSEAYNILTGKVSTENYHSHDCLSDTCLNEKGHPVLNGTFTDFGQCKDILKIDYIFTKNTVQVKEACILDNPKDTVTSDHYPIIATIRI
ncbi:endonuclease/exonuclease/phosphatase family protein [Vallitalea pronyensis]|uniref:Endonuclease/exonuclease/phosphatase family protein n=2 Tax=Vallitalea pronyensis TaxID=1348613 RepID=A0A8J8MJZ0_9FIRM|nr:endonuclease/exonuclease/phosphatase family protein [Vallitalea pronyensis]